jgi:hypothetical protein
VERRQTSRQRVHDLVNLMLPDWRATASQMLWGIRIVIALGILVLIGYPYGITLWDWAQLLIIPAVIAAGGHGSTAGKTHASGSLKSNEPRTMRCKNTLSTFQR